MPDDAFHPRDIKVLRLTLNETPRRILKGSVFLPAPGCREAKSPFSRGSALGRSPWVRIDTSERKISEIERRRRAERRSISLDPNGRRKMVQNPHGSFRPKLAIGSAAAVRGLFVQPLTEITKRLHRPSSALHRRSSQAVQLEHDASLLRITRLTCQTSTEVRIMQGPTPPCGHLCCRADDGPGTQRREFPLGDMRLRFPAILSKLVGVTLLPNPAMAGRCRSNLGAELAFERVFTGNRSAVFRQEGRWGSRRWFDMFPR